MSLSIQTEPAGAEVYRAADGIKVGVTPYADERDLGQGELVLILKHEGYEPARVSMPLSKDSSETIALTAKPIPKKKKKKPSRERDPKRKWGDLLD